jgi:hypothetical protein
MEQAIEDMKAKDGFFDRNQTFELCGKVFHFRTVLPRKAKDWMALDLAELSLVFEENLGVCYEGYTHETALVFLVMRYYTDFQLDEYDDSESWYMLYDILESHGVLDMLYGFLLEDIQKVLKVYEKIKEAAKSTYERDHSLSYLVRKTFGSILSTEDITETIAKSGEVTNTMIQLMGAFNQLQPTTNPKGGIVSFAKRT